MDYTSNDAGSAPTYYLLCSFFDLTGDLTEGFLRYEFGGLFSEFYGISNILLTCQLKA